MSKAELGHIAAPGALLELRVTPKASRNAVTLEDGALRVYVTTVPEGDRKSVV